MLKLQDLFNEFCRDSMIFPPGKSGLNKTFLCINFIQSSLYDLILIGSKFILDLSAYHYFIKRPEKWHGFLVGRKEIKDIQYYVVEGKELVYCCTVYTVQ